MHSEHEKQPLPISKKALITLFDYLDGEANSCDCTLTKTTQFLQAKGHPVGQVVSWLEAHGGYCDCEVMLNLMCRFDDILDRD